MRKIFFAISVLIAIFGIMPNQVYAGGPWCPAFTPATTLNSNPQAAYVLSGTHTGNDSRISAHALSPMEVSVWDQVSNTASFSWTYQSTPCSGAFPLGSKRLPDVALVEHYDAPNWYWYAVVVYGVPTPGVNYYAMYDVYKYIPGSCGLDYWAICVSGVNVKDPGGSVNAVFDNVIRIDAEADGDFAIIWDNNTSSIYKGILAIAGNSSTLCGLCSNSYLLVANVLSGATYQFPDISLYPDASIPGPTAYYCYEDVNSNTDLYVGKVIDLCSGVSSNTANYRHFPAGIGYTYEQTSGTPARPRIACPPNDGTYCADSWTVVSEYLGSSTHDIIGHTSLCGAGFATLHTYTDNGANSPCSTYPVNAYANTDPAVGYGANGTEGIMVGWDCAYSLYSGFSPTASIAVQCNTDGTLYSNTSCIYYNNYLIVSFDNCADCGRVLSISGRDYGSYMQYTFYDAYTPYRVDYKDVLFSSCALRIGRNNINADNVVIFPNPFTEQVTVSFVSTVAQIKVFDMTGNLLLSATGNQDEINQSLNELSMNLPKGVYLLRLDSENSSIFVNKKLIKM